MKICVITWIIGCPSTCTQSKILITKVNKTIKLITKTLLLKKTKKYKNVKCGHKYNKINKKCFQKNERWRKMNNDVADADMRYK